MVKAAMIGAGGYAYQLIQRIWKIPDKIELVAVSSSPQRASIGRQACIDKGVSVYPDVDQLLAGVKGEADVIIIPTPIHTHYDLAKKALDEGFHVWLEKPPVATIQQLDSLIELSEKYGRQVAVMFQNVYCDLTQEIKRRIVAGEFGKVKRVKAIGNLIRGDQYFGRASWSGKLKMGDQWVLDGTINNPLAHNLINELYFAEYRQMKLAKPVSVQAELYHANDIESEDTSSLRIMTEDGVEIIFNASLCSDIQKGCDITIECEKATIEQFNYIEQGSIVYSDGRKEELVDKSDHRIFTLGLLAECFENKRDYLVDLEFCRSFVIAVNGAFESSDKIWPISSECVQKIKKDEVSSVNIKDIRAVLEKAHLESKLLSEIDNVPWTRKTVTRDLTDYCAFSPNNLLSNV